MYNQRPKPLIIGRFQLNYLVIILRLLMKLQDEPLRITTPFLNRLSVINTGLSSVKLKGLNGIARHRQIRHIFSVSNFRCDISVNQEPLKDFLMCRQVGFRLSVTVQD